MLPVRIYLDHPVYADDDDDSGHASASASALMANSDTNSNLKRTSKASPEEWNSCQSVLCHLQGADSIGD